MARKANRNRFIRLWTSFAGLLICMPAVAGAQKQWAPSNWQLTIDGLAQAQVRVISPRNFLELAENGTLRELELEVAPGPLNDALAKAHRTHTRLNSLGLQIKQGAGEPLKIEMKNVLVTGYSFSPAGSDRDKFGRVKLQFHWDRTSGIAVPIPVYQIEATSSGTGVSTRRIEGTNPGTASAPLIGVHQCITCSPATRRFV